MFLESICINDGQPENLEAHIERMRLTALHHGFRLPELPGISSILPSHLTHGKVKWRILYREEIETMEFLPYQPKKVQSLRLVEGDPDYAFKYADRSALEEMLKQKGDCDDILIVRDGLITDTSYSNVVLQQGEHFYTPNSYLLNGTRRQQLLRSGRIKEREIRATDLQRYDRLLQINALLEIGETPSIAIHHIHW
ncbi:aminotransferase class IV [Dysgonomonadaceae bacterium zrk40]|nr:aminotransferase class IV [Dysgonomonadaceae bacterium zrk40]